MGGGGSLSHYAPQVTLLGGLCLGRGSLLGRPPGQKPPYGNERTVRILLKCILVGENFLRNITNDDMRSMIYEKNKTLASVHGPPLRILKQMVCQ